MGKLKWIILIESIIILIILALFINDYISEIKLEKHREQGLLSQRIYSGVLEPKSLLITNFMPLKQDLKEHITKNNLKISVYVENLRNGAWIGINEKEGFFPTSLNKLPVAILIMKKIEEGKLSLDTMLEIKEEDRIDTYGDLYKTKEIKLPLRFVMEKMLKESDNTALSILLNYIDLEDIELIYDYYGVDIGMYESGNTDFVTPKIITNLLKSLYFSSVLEAENSEYLLSLLAQSTFDIKKSANIADNIRIAHKFGYNYLENNEFFHDCGIMYIDETRILYCIMTRNLPEKNAKNEVGYILNKIYKYVIDTRSELEKYQKK